ncbi:MAG: T9SS type A sorting domain-containing protein [Saprospiraceae bacterium]|nr:T9SS type A sorting domain-containing protein [Saprospiraceae bacterium]
MMKTTIYQITIVYFLLGWAATTKGQVQNLDAYLWEYRKPITEDIVVISTHPLHVYVDSLLSGYPWRPLSLRYADQLSESYFIYQEPAAILSVLAWAWPHMSPQMQTKSKGIVNHLMQDEVQAPWANHPVDRSYGSRSESFPVNTDWHLDSPFGNFRPTIQWVYHFWHFAYRSNDSLLVSQYYENIKEWYNSRAHESHWDSGNLYGTYGAHIGMARLAQWMDDATQVVYATNQLSKQLTHGLDLSLVDSFAYHGIRGWDAPYPNNWDGPYGERKDGFIHRGHIFLHLTPEVARYISDHQNLKAQVLQRHKAGKKMFPLWWLNHSPYFSRWTGDEGIGLSPEMFGMVVPLDLWVEDLANEEVGNYFRGTPHGKADLYWLTSYIQWLEDQFPNEWVDVRQTPFLTSAMDVIPKENKLLIDPNPASQLVTLKWDKTISVDQILIWDSGQKLVKTISVIDYPGIAVIQVENWLPGWYHLTLMKESITVGSGKFIKM